MIDITVGGGLWEEGGEVPGLPPAHWDKKEMEKGREEGKPNGVSNRSRPGKRGGYKFDQSLETPWAREGENGVKKKKGDRTGECADPIL